MAKLCCNKNGIFKFPSNNLLQLKAFNKMRSLKCGNEKIN